MGPLGFVNWRAVNLRFCVLMWAVALSLSAVILIHLAGPFGGPSKPAIWHGSLLSAPAGTGLR